MTTKEHVPKELYVIPVTYSDEREGKSQSGNPDIMEKPLQGSSRECFTALSKQITYSLWCNFP